MEPVGLAFSTIALASLFSTCLECFEYFEAGQAIEEDFELLLVKLDVQKERLSTWGDLVGVHKAKEDGHHPMLDEKEDIVRRCMTSLQKLCTDTSKLQDSYGVSIEPNNSIAEVPEESRSSRLKFEAESSREDKMGNSRQTQIRNPSDLIDNLHHMVPISTQDQSRLVCADIATLNIGELRLVQDACRGVYQTWSDIASVMITASEGDTVANRSIDEWIQEASYGMNEVDQTSREAYPSRNATDTFEHLSPSLIWNTDIFFAFTSACFLTDVPGLCGPSTIGEEAFNRDGESFLPGRGTPGNKKWQLGQRITQSMEVYYDDSALQMFQNSNSEYQGFQSEFLKDVFPLGVVYIFCAPCVCALRTAIAISLEEDSTTIRCLIRVDDRMDASCYDDTVQIKRLTSLVDTIKMAESTPVSESNGDLEFYVTQLIDRVWIENRVYALEEQTYNDRPSKSRFDRVQELFASFEPSKANKTAIVILGELDHCQWMMQTSPFPWTPRMPKETEIYKLNRPTHIAKWTRKYMGTFTPRHFYKTFNPGLNSNSGTTAIAQIRARQVSSEKLRL